MTELKPCPFCGGEATMRHDSTDAEYWGWDEWWVECINTQCKMQPESGMTFNTEAEAIAAWNTRAAIEFDNWFYLPKPNEPIVEVTETMSAWDGTKVKTDVYYQIQEQAIVAWARELDEHITKRICEVWNPERTCKNEDGWCSECEHFLHDGFKWCPWCGAKVVWQ